jgi:hypothetical protein
MFVKRLGWTWLASSLLLALGAWASGGNAIAQTYQGDSFCSTCHKAEYADYQQHGHPWMEVHTAGQVPAANLFATIGEPVPALTAGVTWDQVEDIVGNFEGQGSLLTSDGNLHEQSGGVVKPMPTTCNNCHNPCGFEATGNAYSTPGDTTGIQGSWALPGVQCEWCHGAGNTMSVPDGQICRDCHSSGDSQFRIPFDPSTAQFTNHHPEGDEYRRSPHASQGCTGCHDPHKSVWHQKGGVNFVADPTNATEVGNMCQGCHQTANPPAGALQVRLRGSMQQMGVLCADCHMPERSGASTGKPNTGTRRTHIFLINPSALQASDPSNWTTQNSDTGKATTYWNQTAKDGTSYLTLDMVCYNCHTKAEMSFAQLQTAAQTIHRAGLADITVNGQDGLQTVKKGQTVTVSVSIVAGAEAGKSSDIYVIAQGPKGYTSLVPVSKKSTATKWVSGVKPWYTKHALADMSSTTVLTTKTLAPGEYTYWFCVYPADGSQYAPSVPVLVNH